MSTANQRLLDDAIHRATLIERFKGGEVRAIMSTLNRDVFPELFLLLSNRLDRISSRGHGISTDRFQTLTDLVQEIGAMLREGATAAQKRLGSDLVDLAGLEAKWQAKALESVLPVVDGAPLFTVAVPAKSILREVALGQPMNGRFLRDYFRDWSRGTQQAVVRSVNLGLASGESTDQIVRRVRGTREASYRDGILSAPRRQVEGIVRTAVNHTANAANEATYQANADLVKGARWISTLDVRTCLICAGLDGKVFSVGVGPRPPAHPGGCRCRTAAVLKSWKELGIKGLQDLPEGSRASMDGAVPRGTTFGAWIRDQSTERQNEVLGPRRAALMRAGRYTVDDFADDQGRILTLEELAST